MAPQSDNGTHGLRNAGDDAFQLTIDYLKQETLQPLRGIGRFLFMGIAASFCWAIGLLLILIGILRLLQTETGSGLTGDWSWVPYAAVVVLGIMVIAGAAWRITATSGRQRVPAGISRRPAGEPTSESAVAAVAPSGPPSVPPAAPTQAAPVQTRTESQVPPVPPVPPTSSQEETD